MAPRPKEYVEVGQIGIIFFTLIYIEDNHTVQRCPVVNAKKGWKHK
jgi:hypothetical protein